MTTLSFLVPTHREDRPLARALWSIVPQLEDGDEVIVIGDIHDGPLPGVEALCDEMGARYLEHDAGHHCWGHCQVGYGLEHARGQWLHVSDDDDIWTRNAAAYMREAARAWPGRPLLFRHLSYGGMVFWETEGRLARNHIGGHSLVAPNVPGKVGRWTCDYSGDFDYVASCVAAHGGVDSAVWIDQLVNLARPLVEVPRG